MQTTAPQTDWRTTATVYFVKTVSWTFFLGALAVSYMHIVDVFEMLGLDDGQQYLVPAAIDGLMVLGRMGMGARFADSTRTNGKRLFLSMLGLSLVANVAAGLDSAGGMLWGLLVIMGLVITEWYGPQLLPAPAPELSPQQKAAITRAKNAEARRIASEQNRAKRKAAKRPATVAKTAVAKTDLDAELAKLTGN